MKTSVSIFGRAPKATMQSCPTEDDWLAFLDNGIEQAMRLDLIQHLDACRACRTLNAELLRQSAPSNGALRSLPGLAGARHMLEGTILGRYFILHRLGEGGMGVVYSAYDPELERKVAIKLLKTDHRHASASPHGTHLLTEARALARVIHPNVVAIHDVGEFDAQRFISMELVDGPTLRQWSQGRSWQEVLQKLHDAASGLSAAHAAGLIHGDFKPDNVLVSTSRDTAIVSDFGLAKELRPRGNRNSISGGTLAYMAPELRGGGEATVLSDQYAFCVAAHELLFGHRPHETPQHQHKRATPPESLRRILHKGLSSVPASRHQDMTVLGRALRSAPKREKQKLAALFGATLAVFVAGGTAVTYSITKSRCDAMSHQMKAVWSINRREALESAFRSTGLPVASDAWRRFEIRVSRWVDDWELVRKQTCIDASMSAAGNEDNVAIQCLEQSRRQLVALLDSLNKVDEAAVRLGVRMTESLTAPTSCVAQDANASWVASGDVQADQALAEIEALFARGQYIQAADASERFVSTLRSGHPLAPVAWTLHLHASLRADRFDEVDRNMLHAVSTAQSAGRDDLVATIASRFASSLAKRLVRLDEAKRWLELARASHTRMGRLLPSLNSGLESAEGLIALREGKADMAEAAFRRSVADAVTAYGPDDLHVAGELNNVVVALGEQQKIDEAIAVSASVIQIYESKLGPFHPDLIAPVSNRGILLSYKAYVDEAVTEQQRAVDIARKAYHRRSYSLAYALGNLSSAAQGANDNTRALAFAREAYGIAAELEGDQGPLAMHLYSLMGSTEVRVGNIQQALKTCREAYNAYAKGDITGREASAAMAAECLGESLLQSRNAPSAVKYYEHALNMLDRGAPSTLQRAQVQFGLARALASSRGDRLRIRQLALAAKVVFDSVHAKKELEDVSRFLESQEGVTSL